MVKVLEVASPKGGVGKSTESVTLATIAAIVYKLNVCLVDADDSTHTAHSWTRRAGADIFPFDVRSVSSADVHLLADLKRAGHWDLIVVDMPGTKAGAWDVMLTGRDGKPVPDLLLLPSRESWIELRPVVHTIESEIIPLGVPYLLAFLPIWWQYVPYAEERRELLRTKRGIKVADTIVRQRSAYIEAFELNKTVLHLPGARSTAREAERDQRDLAAEVFAPLGITKP